MKWHVTHRRRHHIQLDDLNDTSDTWVKQPQTQWHTTQTTCVRCHHRQTQWHTKQQTHKWCHLQHSDAENTWMWCNTVTWHDMTHSVCQCVLMMPRVDVDCMWYTLLMKWSRGVESDASQRLVLFQRISEVVVLYPQDTTSSSLLVLWLLANASRIRLKPQVLPSHWHVCT